MANYQLRDVNDYLWQSVATRAQMEGWPLKALILQLLADYLEGKALPSTPPPAAPAPRRGPYVQLRFTCPACNTVMELDVLAVSKRSAPMQTVVLPCPSCGVGTVRAIPAGPLKDAVRNIRRAGEAPGT